MDLIISYKKDEVLNFIDAELCGRLGSLNATCVDYVQKEGAQIIQLLLKSVVTLFNSYKEFFHLISKLVFFTN